MQIYLVHVRLIFPLRVDHLELGLSQVRFLVRKLPCLVNPLFSISAQRQ